MNKSKLIQCVCHSNEHIIIAWVDGDQIFMSIHLKKFNFWNRAISGIKYIFGYTCKYGNFEEFLIDSSNVEDFKELLKEIDKSSS